MFGLKHAVYFDNLEGGGAQITGRVLEGQEIETPAYKA